MAVGSKTTNHWPALDTPKLTSFHPPLERSHRGRMQMSALPIQYQHPISMWSLIQEENSSWRVYAPVYEVHRKRLLVTGVSRNLYMAPPRVNVSCSSMDFMRR